MRRETCKQLAGKQTPERCLEAAFRFLLDREPKESILGCFDVTVISRYFPEFERALPRYLSPPRWAAPVNRRAYFTTIVELSTISCPRIQSGGIRASKRSPQSTPTSALENFRSMIHCAQL